MQTKKSKKPVKIVSKPFVHGEVTDQHTLGSSIKFFLVLMGTMLAFLALGTTLAFDFPVVTLLLNGGLLAGALIMYMNSGATKAVVLVTQGEVLQSRLDDGRNIDKGDKRASFHKYKGLVTALLGTLPFFIMALILAFTAQRQMTSTGTLPSWIGYYEDRPEIGEALKHYHIGDTMTVTAFCRIAVRMLLMPMVAIVGTTNFDGLLVLERLSPVLVLLPAVAYGVGYARGPQVRARVHTTIAASKRKRARKEKRLQRERRQRSEPEQLN